MKRLLFLTTMFLCSLLTFAQFEGTVSDSQGVQYTANDDALTCYVSGWHYNYSTTTIIIPEEIQGRTVTRIADGVFAETGVIHKVTIGNSVTSIGDRAFSSCRGLKTVTIGNSVTSIGQYAFNNCSNLEKVIVRDLVVWCNISFGDDLANPLYFAHHLYSDENTEITDLVIPNSVTNICNSLFSGCSGLTSVEIPNSVTSIGNRAFYQCSGLTSVTIGNSVTSIGEWAFCGCSSLTSVEIPNSVTSIGGWAFEDCGGLTSVEIGNGVTSIGGWAFENCSGLTSVTFHCKTIEGWFSNIPSLKTVIIGNGVTNICDYAFVNCDSLSSMIVSSENNTYDSRDNCNAIIETATNTLIAGCKNTMIPNSVTSIGNGAFDGCSGLTSVTIPNSVTSIGECAFCDCSGLTSVTIPNSVTSIGDYAFQGCSGLTSVEILNSVTSIGYGAFWGCSGLTSIEIPNSVTSIGEAVFQNCSGLTSMVVSSANTKYDSRNNCNAIIETATNTLISGCKNTVIPNSVTSIGNRAFAWCSGLTGSLEIPNSITSIGNEAFDFCSSLTSVEIPNSVTSIGSWAFRGCSGLTSVEIGNGVTSIGQRAFERCINLTSVEIGNNVTSIGNGAFVECYSLISVIAEMKTPVEIVEWTFENRANATLYVPAGCKETYEAANYWKEFKEIIEMDIQPIDTGETVDFGSDIDGDTDLDGNIVGDIYYVISNDDGGYDVAEGCIVVTTPTDDSTIDGQDIFGEDFQDNYTGIVLKVPAGRGTITVEAQTIGTMVLKVKIGTAAPVTMELDGRLKVSFPYDVTEPTYVYIYGGSNASAAPDMAGRAAGGELKLYGIEVAPGATGIEPIDHSTLNIEHYYTLDGRMLQGEPTQKGVYIVNGRKYVVK